MNEQTGRKKKGWREAERNEWELVRRGLKRLGRERMYITYIKYWMVTGKEKRERWRVEGKGEQITLLIILMRLVCVCVSGLLKTHNLSFQDCECLQAVFDKDNCSNVLRAQPRSSFLPSFLPPSLFSFIFTSVSVSLPSSPVFYVQVVGGYSTAFPALSGGSERFSEQWSGLAQEPRGRWCRWCSARFPCYFLFCKMSSRERYTVPALLGCGNFPPSTTFQMHQVA